LVCLSVTRISINAYQQSIQSLSWLMTPSTVCLAIPMYEQFRILRKNLPAILAGVVCGALGCLGMVLIFSAAAGFDRTLTVSLLPKSVTSAIGAPLSTLSGGVASVTTAAIILSGILANMLSIPLFRLFRLTDKVAQGVAMGTAGHVIATSKANELDPLTGAVSSLSLVVAGLITAVVLPLFASFI
jgi:putative effector of murein hydrolase